MYTGGYHPRYNDQRCMNKPSSMTQFTINASSFVYGWILVGLNIIISAVFWWQLPVQIPLFYSLPYGDPQLAAREWFFLLPGLSILLLMGYLLLSRLVVGSKIFLNIIRWLHLLGLFLLTVAMVHILFIVL